MWGEMGRDGTMSGWHGKARAGTEGLGSHGAMSPHATAFLSPLPHLPLPLVTPPHLPLPLCHHLTGTTQGPVPRPGAPLG